jgi:methionine synthase II (cobalamin-independent)
MAAPSYHRRNWVDHISTGAYDSCEEFLQDVRDWMNGLARWLASQDCEYIQLDAPNYGSLCDPETRQFHADHGHDLERQIAFDAALDSSVFDGLDHVTSAIHVCRGNLPGGAWHSSGGYGVLADSLFANLDVDVVLLEYDSGRAGDFSPIGALAPGTTVVLGLLTTKDGALETGHDVEARISEASKVRPLDELAISTQCGFASFTDERRAGAGQTRPRREHGAAHLGLGVDKHPQRERTTERRRDHRRYSQQSTTSGTLLRGGLTVRWDGEIRRHGDSTAELRRIQDNLAENDG